MKSTFIETTIATGDEIWAINQKLEPILKEENPYHAVMACLTIALMLQKPSLSAEELHAGVLEVSQFMAMWLASSHDNASPKGLH